MRKKTLYTKNTYILKLLLSIVTAGIETLVASGNKFFYAFVREICHRLLSHVFMPSMNSSLLLKCCDPIQFFRQVNRW
jgi:hypothetical protein